MWYLIPSLTLAGNSLNLLKQGIKTLTYNLLHAYFDWFNNFWPDINFHHETICQGWTVTNLILKSKNFSGTWMYTIFLAEQQPLLAACLFQQFASSQPPMLADSVKSCQFYAKPTSWAKQQSCINEKEHIMTATIQTNFSICRMLRNKRLFCVGKS